MRGRAVSTEVLLALVSASIVWGRFDNNWRSFEVQAIEKGP